MTPPLEIIAEVSMDENTNIINNEEDPVDIIRNVEEHIRSLGFTFEEAAHIMAIGRNTYARRLKKPEDFTLKELTALCEYCGMDFEDLLK